MLKNSTIKIFSVFMVLVIAQSGLFLFVFSKLALKDAQNHLYEILLSRSQLTAQLILQDLKDGRSLEAALSSRGVNAVVPGQQILGPHSTLFDLDVVSKLDVTGQAASLVTPCLDTQGTRRFCAFSRLTDPNIVIFLHLPESSQNEILKAQIREVLPWFMLILLAALGSTWLISFLLQRPLRNITKAARRVAHGEWVDTNLPLERTDEVGELAQAFKAMIQELKSREQNFTRQGLKLAHQARLASVGQMGASIAHEVKNPLTSMMGYAKHLAAHTQDPQLREAAVIIQKEADRCSQILSQMLKFSRSESQDLRHFSMKEVVESTLLLLKAELKSFAMHVEIAYHQEPIVYGNPQHLQQVLINLIMNAIHACREVVDEKPEARKIKVDLYEENGRARIRIEDSGPGMSPEAQLRVFEPFFTTKERGQGTGLGLSVALELMQAQKGDLQFESQVGRGTTFWIDLPLPADNRIQNQQP